MGTKTWNREADGIYRHIPSKILYWRPWIDRKRTWESLGTANLKLAKETYHKRAASLQAAVTEQAAPITPIPAGTTTGRVIRKYEQDGYPDKHKATRTGQTLKDDKKHCKTLLPEHIWIPTRKPAWAKLQGNG